MIKLSDFYKSIFGCKTYKISLDSGCTCPNRDGTKGFGGCIFCSERGSGDFTPERQKSISEQIKEAKKKVEAKIRGRGGNRKGKYIAYFQNFTSTYGNTENLLKMYSEALYCEGVAGLAIATRPDCVSEKILLGIRKILLQKTAENFAPFIQIELGLQTSNENTGKFINRCYTNEDYIEALERIRKILPSAHIVTHLIFGLPGDTKQDVLESVKFVVKNNQTNSQFQSLFGIKITVLYIVEHTRLAQLYKDGLYTPLEKQEYYSLLEQTVPLLPENCVVHRLTGDPPKSILIEPKWPTDKKRILNEINKIFENK